MDNKILSTKVSYPFPLKESVSSFIQSFSNTPLTTSTLLNARVSLIASREEPTAPTVVIVAITRRLDITDLMMPIKPT